MAYKLAVLEILRY